MSFEYLADDALSVAVRAAVKYTAMRRNWFVGRCATRTRYRWASFNEVSIGNREDGLEALCAILIYV